MFGKKPESDQTKIRLPRRSMPPTKDYLEFAFTQAFQYRDKEVEITWSDNISSRLFRLVVCAQRDKDSPQWALSEDNNQSSQLLWSVETSDLGAIALKISMIDLTTGQNASVTQPAQGESSTDSSYRKTFSDSQQGILPPAQDSLRDSFSRMRAVNPSSFDSANENIFVLKAKPMYDRQIQSSQELSISKSAFNDIAGEKGPSAAFAGIARKDKARQEQLSHLIKAGLEEQSVMVKKQDDLGDNELRLLLSKNNDADSSGLIALYKRLPKRFTVSQLSDNRPDNQANWVPIVFSFFTNNLIEIKAPLAVNESSLEFLGSAKGAVQALKSSFVRQETGIFSYPALLYFLQYEYLRYQSYDCPLSLIIFEMAKISNNALGGLDLISQQETSVALQRIIFAKRPMDLLGHFETMDYALLLPNTTLDVAQQVAQKMINALMAQPLSTELDAKFLKLSFGIGSIPGDCPDLEALVILTKKALQQSKNGDFVIVQAGSVS